MCSPQLARPQALARTALAFFRPELQAQAAPPGCSNNKVTGLMKCARNRDHGSGLEDIIQPAGFIRGRKKERALLKT